MNDQTTTCLTTHIYTTHTTYFNKLRSLYDSSVLIKLSYRTHLAHPTGNFVTTAHHFVVRQIMYMENKSTVTAPTIPGRKIMASICNE